MKKKNEPPSDKTNKVSVRPAKTQISLDIHFVGFVMRWLKSLYNIWAVSRIKKGHLSRALMLLRCQWAS